MECLQETFFLEPVYVKIGILDCATLSLEKEQQFRKGFSGGFENLEHPFLFEHFPEIYVVKF